LIQFSCFLTRENRIARALVRRRDVWGSWTNLWAVIRTSTCSAICSRASPVFTQRSPKTEPENQIENLADTRQRWQQEVGRSSNTDRLSKLPLLERLTDTTDAQRQLRRRDQ
jgi:hypothetical protein